MMRMIVVDVVVVVARRGGEERVASNEIGDGGIGVAGDVVDVVPHARRGDDRVETA